MSKTGSAAQLAFLALLLLSRTLLPDAGLVKAGPTAEAPRPEIALDAHLIAHQGSNHPLDAKQAFPVSNQNLTIAGRTSNSIVTLYLPMVSSDFEPAATARYVATTGNDAHNCRSPRAACRTIQWAIDGAWSGCTVHVAAGTYTETVTLKDGVSLIGFGSDATTVYGNGVDNVVTCASDSAIEGFTIVGTEDGSAASNRGIYCNGTTGSVIRYNTLLGAGKGIETRGSVAEIAFNRAIDNQYQGISVTDGTVYIHHNIAVDTNYGIQNWRSGGQIANNVISGYIVALEIGGLPSPVVRNNILFDAGLGVLCKQGATPDLRYNDLWDNTQTYSACGPGTGDISSDPLFVDAGSHDYHLQPCSPAIDVGDPTSGYSNEPAPNGGRINMGAYGNTAEATSYACP